MAYCITGNYTIQNCLGIGIDPASYALDVVGVGTTANVGAIIANFRNSGNAARLYIVDEDGGAGAEKPGGILSTTGYGLGLYSNSPSAAIKFYAGGCAAANELMRICSNGRVGIGTTTPGFKLQVDGSPGDTIGFFGASGMTAGQSVYFQVGKNCTSINNAGEISFKYCADDSSCNVVSLGFYGNGQKLNIVKSGNVGIGTMSPGATLTVTGPNATGAFFQAANDGAGGAVFCRINASSYPYNSFNFFNGNMGIGAYASLSNVNLQICDGNANGTDDMVRLMQCLPGNHAFYRAQRCGGATLIMGPTRNSGDGCIPSESAIIWTTTNNPIVIGTCGRQRMRFATDGNAVLGGTSSNVAGFSGTVLTVNGAGSYQGYEVTTSGVSRMTLVSDGLNGYVSTRAAGMCLIFETDAATERMRITSCGNVGIGSSSPSSRLHVVGSGTAGSRCAIAEFRDTNNVQRIDIRDEVTASCQPPGLYSPTAGFGLGLYAQTGPIVFYANGITTSEERMRITSCGCVGIGICSPSYRLHVNGTFYAAGSSIKYKEGICQYDTDSCLFMCLKPVTYQYKDEWQHLGRELKSQSQIGLIAEDVAQVMPELAILVNEEDEKVVRNVDYEKLSVVLLKEVQKLRQEVDQLKNR